MRSNKRKVVALCSALFALIFFFLWFYALPRHMTSLGMSKSEIQRKFRGFCEVIPLSTALSAPPSTFELANTPRYYVRVPLMGLTMHFNSYDKVVHIEFLVGNDKGSLLLTTPKLGDDPGPKRPTNSNVPSHLQ